MTTKALAKCPYFLPPQTFFSFLLCSFLSPYYFSSVSTLSLTTLSRLSSHLCFSAVLQATVKTRVFRPATIGLASFSPCSASPLRRVSCLCGVLCSLLKSAAKISFSSRCLRRVQRYATLPYLISLV